MPTNPYTEQNDSGYNSSPPPDDGTESEANRVKYSTIKTKLSDPILTFAEDIDDAVLAAFAKVINTDDDENNSMGGSLAFAQSELTIASGVITPTRTYHNIDTEADASTDELSTAIATSVSNNAILIIKSANGGRVVTVKHNTDEGSTGNPKFFMSDGNDFELSHINNTQRSIGFQLRGSNEWHEIFRSETSQGKLIQEVYAEDLDYDSTTTTIPLDDTIPQNTEGEEVVTVSITPNNSSNILLIDAGTDALSASVTDETATLALFQDSTADALAATSVGSGSNANPNAARLFHRRTAGTTSAITFKLRYGPATGTAYINGDNTGRHYGGIGKTHIHVMEIEV